MTSKLIYAATSALLEALYSGVVGTNSSADGYRSIAITGDGYFYTHGQKFRIYKVVNNQTEGILLGWNNQDGTLQLLDGNTQLSSVMAVGTITGDSIITATRGANDAKSYTITHAQPANLVVSATYGVANTMDAISLPSLTIDSYGHITAIQNVSVDATKVKAAVIANNDNNNYSIIGVNGNTIQQPKYVANTYIDKNGYIYEAGTALSEKYAAKVYATDQVTGTVYLSDATNGTEAAADGHTAATPLAVSNALALAKQYAKDLFSDNDALVFVGTIDSTGTFKSHNSSILPNVVDNNSSINSTTFPYKAGYTLKFTSAGTITLGETGYEVSYTVEPGDVLLCINDKGTEFKGSDFTVIQNNIDGSITSSTNLTGVLYGTGSRVISALDNPNSTSYLKYDATNGLTWVDKSDTYRTLYLTSSSGTAITNKNVILQSAVGNGNTTPLEISFDNSGANAVITYTVYPQAIIKESAKKLTIQHGNNKFEYNTLDAKTLNVGTNLALAIENSTYTLKHDVSGVTAQTTAAVGKIKVDAQGHITEFTTVTTLPNTGALYLAKSGTVVQASPYTGATPFVYNFIPGTDVSINTTTHAESDLIYTPGSTAGGIDINVAFTHRYRPVTISKVTSGSIVSGNAAYTDTALFTDAVSTALTLREGLHVTLTAANDIITIASSWRPISAYYVNSGSLALGALTNDSSLTFSSDFLVDNGELAIYWTEIDNEGNVTYVK